MDTTYRITLTGYNQSTQGSGKLNAIKELRYLMQGMGLKEAKHIVEGDMPVVLVEDASAGMADAARSCTWLVCRVEPTTAAVGSERMNAETRELWRMTYVAALTGLLRDPIDDPSVAAKRFADRAVADYRSIL